MWIDTIAMHIPNKQSGVGLIEVLIAVVVLSIGFLAAAKMQVQGMRYSQSAYYLSQGNFMLRDITDRMRANRRGVLDGFYDDFTTVANTTEPTCVAATVRCTPEQIAQADKHAWSKNLYPPSGAVDFKPLLPSVDLIEAEGSIAYDPTTNVYTISVSWAEQVDDDYEERVLSVQLTQ